VAFLEHGDEVILFEPFFDQYLPSVTFNGGVPVYVPLHPRTAGVDKPTGHDWKIDFDELRFVSPSAESETRTERSVSDARLLPEQK
jgi:kynurenine aminotransferase